jgi:hypothetical protein
MDKRNGISGQNHLIDKKNGIFPHNGCQLAAIMGEKLL